MASLFTFFNYFISYFPYLGMFYMCGINKATGEAAMYPKMVQDLAGWKTRSMHSGLVQ